MAMYLNKVPVYVIMLLGRWSSDAFLRYIRKQVQQFSTGVSSAMLNGGSFLHVPTRGHLEDPTRASGTSSVKSNLGAAHLGGQQSWARQEAFNVWNADGT